MKSELANHRKSVAINSIAPLRRAELSCPNSEVELKPRPRVLVVLETDSAWSRGILRGFMTLAHECGWTVLHYRPGADLKRLVDEWQPAAAVIGPELDARAIAALDTLALVSVNADRSSAGIASICLDDPAIAELAVEHLLTTGLRHVTTLRLSESPVAVVREQAFEARARAAHLVFVDGWRGVGDAADGLESSLEIIAWLRALPKPCGIFTCTDSWGRITARYVRLAGLRVPEDIALIGVDNDTFECELCAPPLSSVLVPWRDVGEEAAKLVVRMLAQQPIDAKRSEVSPLSVVARRSSDVLAVDDQLVAAAVTWIRANAERRLMVSTVVRAVSSGRQRLERAFRRVLDRSIQEEIRRSHVDVARRLLETTQGGLPEIAQRSGFTNATLLNLAFQRELGLAPGAYRRQMLKALSNPGD